MLPQLRKLEERYPREVAVVGVHSGKYTTERVTDRIREATLRLGVTHPVVNDRQFRVWRSYAVNAWPTLVVVDPRGYVLGQHAGEFTLEALEPFVQGALRSAEDQGTLRRSEQQDAPECPAIQPGTLRYPGKVALGPARRLAIADSGHHRVLIGRLDAARGRLRLEHVAGGGARGLQDGRGEDARFDYPQGMAFHENTLMVADAGNHALRAIDLDSGTVRTLVGTGAQLRTAADLRAGALSSPWDVCVAGDRVFIAMAGTHQLWSVGVHGEGLRVHSGNRHEALVDGPQQDAALAQPMGIARDTAGEWLYFVDAESSAIRRATVDPAGTVETIIGTGLFDFGDRDGSGDRVLMQHQQGLAVAEDGRLIVADSYNDALKWVDPTTREASTWTRGFHEPSGVAVDAAHVYVADTNAHRIAVVDRHTGAVEDLAIGP